MPDDNQSESVLTALSNRMVHGEACALVFCPFTEKAYVLFPDGMTPDKLRTISYNDLPSHVQAMHVALDAIRGGGEVD